MLWEIGFGSRAETAHTGAPPSVARIYGHRPGDFKNGRMNHLAALGPDAAFIGLMGQGAPVIAVLKPRDFRAMP